MIAVGLAHVFRYDGEIARARCRRKAQAQMRGIHLVHLDALYLGELLDAALYLYRFGCLVAEAFYKCFRVLYLFLLVAIGSHLLLQSFGAEVF